MKCYKCERQPIAHELTMFPIDPKGHNRRWVCTECATTEEMALVSKDVKEVVNVIESDS